MQQYKHLKPDEAYHAIVETENHDFVLHMATNSKYSFMFYLNFSVIHSQMISG